jgi:hypothetical protein
VTDLITVPVVLVWLAFRVQELQGHRFQRKAWGFRQWVAGSESLQAAPEREMHEAMRVKLQVQGRPKDAGDTMYMEHLTGKAVGSE